MKFSIIIPVFNTEKYLKKCLSTVLNQDILLEEYEIILINDGSTDSSSIICEEYKERFSNIIFLDQTNMGQSVARNRGLEIAKGKYIVFVDSDDYISENILSTIFLKMENEELDVLAFDSAGYTTTDKMISILKPGKFIPGKIVTGIDFISNDGFKISVTVWSYIYKQEFLNREKIVFTEKIFHEDCEWTVHWFPVCKRIGYIDEIFYHYVLSDVSTMRSINIKKSYDLIYIAKLVYGYAEKYRCNGNINVYRSLKNYSGFMAWSALRSCVQQGFRIEELVGQEKSRQNLLKYGYLNKKYRFIFFCLKNRKYKLVKIMINIVIKIKKHKIGNERN